MPTKRCNTGSHKGVQVRRCKEAAGCGYDGTHVGDLREKTSRARTGRQAVKALANVSPSKPAPGEHGRVSSRRVCPPEGPVLVVIPHPSREKCSTVPPRRLHA